MKEHPIWLTIVFVVQLVVAVVVLAVAAAIVISLGAVVLPVVVDVFTQS